MVNVKDYYAPCTLEELARIVSPGQATLFAGGTDLMPQTQSGVRRLLPTLVNLGRVAELHGILEADGHIRLGALTTVSEILDSRLLRAKAAVLPYAADRFASGQVRNMATIGGNICNASPAADMVIPLLLLDACVELASWSNDRIARRTVPLCDFFLAPGRTVATPHEVLTCVEFPVPDEGAVALFAKFGTRPALDIAIVSVGVAGVRIDGALRRARVAFGALAPTPIRGRMAERVLEEASLDDDGIARAVAAADRDIAPISDIRASEWYRRELTRHLMEELLRHVARTRD